MEGQFIPGMFVTILDPAERGPERRIWISDPHSEEPDSQAQYVAPLRAERSPSATSHGIPHWLVPEEGQA